MVWIPGGSFPFPAAQEKSHPTLGPKTSKIPPTTPWGSPFNDLPMFSCPLGVSDVPESQTHRDTSQNYHELFSAGEAQIMRAEMFGEFSFTSSLSHNSEYMSSKKAQADPSLEGEQGANW